MTTNLVKHGGLPPFAVGLHGSKLEKKEVYLDLDWHIKEKERWLIKQFTYCLSRITRPMCAVPNTTINRSKEALEFSGNISESSTAYSTIGKNRLDLAKIETGNVELKIEPVHCQELLDEVANALRPVAEAKQLHFEVILPITKVIIQTDRHALSQILLNLTHNAIRFTETGSICIELRRRLESRRVKISTEFSVEDTGPGIRPEELTRLFQARRHRSTGLGLYLSQKLASLLDGRIEVMSVHGKGSIFRLVVLGK
ncbi:MAG: sensor histidine kinase [Anaerolineales bacterium]